jgi:hypothetical protein
LTTVCGTGGDIRFWGQKQTLIFPIFRGVRVAFIFCVFFVDNSFSFWPFSFGSCILLLLMASDYPFDIFFYWWLLITPLASSFIDGFWLPLWHLLLLMASDYPFDIFFYWWLLITPLTSSFIDASDYPFGIFFYWWLLIIPLASSFIDGFWLPLWHFLLLMASDYPFGIFKLFLLCLQWHCLNHLQVCIFNVFYEQTKLFTIPSLITVSYTLTIHYRL